MMTHRTPIVGMSLKIYHNKVEEVVAFARSILSYVKNEDEIEFFLFPSLGTLYPVAQVLEASVMGYGAQNIAPAANGAYTGEYSIESLLDIGGRYVEIGHSERRRIFHESDEMVHDKVMLTLEKGMTPVLCIGEPKKTADFSYVRDHLAKQLHSGLLDIKKEQLQQVIIAYEPVWAIGASEAASPRYVGKVHGLIRDILKESYGDAADGIRIIYGGSVSKENARDIVANHNVDGVFIGRFGHDPENYSEIVNIVREEKVNT